MSQVSVNQLLEMKKRLQDRKAELTPLVRSSATETIQTFTNGATQTTKHKYDVVDIDTRVSEIQEAMYEIDHKVKEANAKTLIEMSADFNFKKLISALKPAP